MITNLVTPVLHSKSSPFHFGLVFPQILKLRLLTPVTCPTSLLRFILAFPKISSLEIRYPRWIHGIGEDHSSLAPRDRNDVAFGGSLCLAGLGAKFDEFTSLLVEQGMKFKSVQLVNCGFSSNSAMRNFSDAIHDTLCALTVAPLDKGEWTTAGYLWPLTSENRAEVDSHGSSCVQRLEGGSV